MTSKVLSITLDNASANASAISELAPCLPSYIAYPTNASARPDNVGDCITTTGLFHSILRMPYHQPHCEIWP